MAKQAAIVFDFDGTIADSLVVLLDVLYEVMHTQPLPKEDISRLRNMDMRHMMRELHIPLWRAIFMAKSARRLMSNRMNEIELVPGMEEAIRGLARGHQLYLVSANSAENVRIFFKRYNLEQYFTAVYGSVRPWRKQHTLKRLLHERSLNPSATWYVGDGAWDIKAAHAVGMKAAAVAWGFSNIHILEKSNPDALVFDATELAERVK